MAAYSRKAGTHVSDTREQRICLAAVVHPYGPIILERRAGIYVKKLHECKLGTSLLCLYFYLLCYAAVFIHFTYYAQYYADLCLRIWTVLLEYIH